MTDVCTARPTCGKEVAPTELTCPACLARTRQDLAQIVDLAALMPEEAEHAGINSEAAALSGPIAEPAGWFRRRRHVLAGGLCRCPVDACPDDIQPAGPVCECWHGRPERMHQSCSWILGPRCPSKRDWLGANLDEASPAWTLGIWDMMLREDYGMPSRDRLTVAAAVKFLDGILHRLANDPAQDFALFAHEVHQCRTHLEAVLHNSRTSEQGAPCPECAVANPDGKARPLVKRYVDDDPTGASDRWDCRDCGSWWGEADYRLRIGARYLQHADRLTASQMLDVYRIKPGALRKWAERGQVRKHGKDEQGRQLYDVASAVAMRDRASVVTEAGA